MNLTSPKPHLIAWEITRSCNLYCAHCRSSSTDQQYSNELSTPECFTLIDDILKCGNPIMILSGGEPLMRDDFLDIAYYASNKGLRIAVGTNGTLITHETAVKMKDVPVSRIGVSLDFPTPALQDQFRGTTGAFEAALKGIDTARSCGIQVQLNSTITKLNVHYLDDLLSLALEVGAVAFHPFMLVPTGRGKDLEKEELPPEEYERVLNWIYDKQVEVGERIFLKPTDAPHYMRVLDQRGQNHPDAIKYHSHGSMNSLSRGCLAGTGFCFISHVGNVQGCGYLNIPAGNVRKEKFSNIWYNSPFFNELRDYTKIEGKCGICYYKSACGGCRARAYEVTGNYLAEEPYCLYNPSHSEIQPSNTTPGLSIETKV